MSSSECSARNALIEEGIDQPIVTEDRQESLFVVERLGADQFWRRIGNVNDDKILPQGEEAQQLERTPNRAARPAKPGAPGSGKADDGWRNPGGRVAQTARACPPLREATQAGGWDKGTAKGH